MSVPIEGVSARETATGVMQTSGRTFNVSVAFNKTAEHGRLVTSSTIHHFLDDNLDTSIGCPSFVSEPTAGESLRRNPRALADSRQHFRNIAASLS